MRQIDIFGGEHEPERESAPAGEPLELFDVAAFSHRVPGTIALEVDRCPFCDAGAPVAHSWLEDDGGAGVRLSCCDACWQAP